MQGFMCLNAWSEAKHLVEGAAEDVCVQSGLRQGQDVPFLEEGAKSSFFLGLMPGVGQVVSCHDHLDVVERRVKTHLFNELNTIHSGHVLVCEDNVELIVLFDQ